MKTRTKKRSQAKSPSAQLIVDIAAERIMCSLRE